MKKTTETSKTTHGFEHMARATAQRNRRMRLLARVDACITAEAATPDAARAAWAVLERLVEHLIAKQPVDQAAVIAELDRALEGEGRA